MINIHVCLLYKGDILSEFWKHCTWFQLSLLPSPLPHTRVTWSAVSSTDRLGSRFRCEGGRGLRFEGGDHWLGAGAGSWGAPRADAHDQTSKTTCPLTIPFHTNILLLLLLICDFFLVAALFLALNYYKKNFMYPLIKILMNYNNKLGTNQGFLFL